jgi:L-threonylcarbamoyladenylate synthase
MTAKPTARIYRATDRNLTRLARALRAGEIVAVPTETVYGLAANALDARACRKIFRAKGRPANDPLIVHVHSLAQLDFIAEPNPAAFKLARAFWPGPLTLVLPKRAVVPDVVSSHLPSVAVRMPRHPLFRRLLKLSGLPLAAPSANPFGYISPTSAAHVEAGLGKKIAHILDGGPSSIGVESTIIDLRNPKAPRVLRPGAITRTELEGVLGVRVLGAPRGTSGHAQVAPGLLKRHYSPRTPSSLHERFSLVAIARGSEREAWIFLAKPRGVAGKNIFWLDDRGQLKGAARRLFDILRRVDTGGFDHIHLERASGGGLADAINDRLERAAAR